MSSQTHLQLSTNKLGEGLGAVGLGALNGGTKGTVDDQLGKDTQSTGNTEEDGVVVGLSQAIVLEEDTRVLHTGQYTGRACNGGAGS